MPEIKQTRSFLLLGRILPACTASFCARTHVSFRNVHIFTCFLTAQLEYLLKFIYFKAHKAGFDAHLPTVLNTFCLVHHIHSHFTFVVPASRSQTQQKPTQGTFFPLADQT